MAFPSAQQDRIDQQNHFLRKLMFDLRHCPVAAREVAAITLTAGNLNYLVYRDTFDKFQFSYEWRGQNSINRQASFWQDSPCRKARLLVPPAHDKTASTCPESRYCFFSHWELRMAVSFKSSKGVDQGVVADALTALAVTVAADYSGFLKTVNGGIPKPRKLMADDGDYKVERLYSVSAASPGGHGGPYDLVAINRHFRSELELPVDYLAIGLVDEEDVLLLQVAGDTLGTVSVWSFIESGFTETRVTAVAASFIEFLRLLEQPSEKAQQRAALRKQFSALEMAILSRKWPKVRTLAAQLDQSLWEPDMTHPVFYAIECLDLEGIEQLHAAGICFEIRNHRDESPRVAAELELQSNQGVIEFLKSQGQPGPFDDSEARVATARAILEFLQKQEIA